MEEIIQCVPLLILFISILGNSLVSSCYSIFLHPVSRHNGNINTPWKLQLFAFLENSSCVFVLFYSVIFRVMADDHESSAWPSRPWWIIHTHSLMRTRTHTIACHTQPHGLSRWHKVEFFHFCLHFPSSFLAIKSRFSPLCPQNYAFILRCTSKFLRTKEREFYAKLMGRIAVLMIIFISFTRAYHSLGFN